MSRLAAVLLAATYAVCAANASAQTVVVPDDYPTIQQAIDSDADTVRVGTGFYPERLFPSHGVVLLPAPQPLNGFYDSAPEILSIGFAGSSDPKDYRRSLTMRGFTVRGTALLPDPGDHQSGRRVSFESCRFDSGITQPSTFGAPGYSFERLLVRGCTIRGSVSAAAAYVDFSHNAIIRGDVVVFSEGDHVVHGNYWLDAPGTALTTNSVGPIEVTDNVIEGAVTGVRLVHVTPGYIYRNRVIGATGSAFEATGESVDFVDNEARDCGGYGFDLEETLGGYVLQRNTIIHCDAGGIRAKQWHRGSIEENIIGRCGGAGIASNGLIRRNTLYLNAGSAIVVVAGHSGGPVDRNIAFENGGYGLDVQTETAPALACNDWFQNVGGAINGGAPDDSDLSVDPLFCNLAADSVTLRQGSPLLDSPGCGLIGADSLGCLDATTETRTPGGPPAEVTTFGLELSAPSPNPTARETRLAFTIPTAMHVRLTIIDVQGREVGRLINAEQSAGRHETIWTAAQPGAYFVRLEAGGCKMVRRALVLR